MLIRFRVKNFLSFKDEVEFSMIPGKTRNHTNHIISGGDSRHAVNLLRGAVIYGANASGKSNMIKAMDFARTLILEGTKTHQTIQTKPFKLDSKSLQNPSKFEFEIRTKGKDYLYGFELTPAQIVSEWLYELKLTTQELLFERQASDNGQIKVEFGNIKFKSKKEKDFLDFVGMGTRPNQLFLTESMDKNINLFESVFRWFSSSLTIIFPETRFRISEKNTKDIDLLSFYLERFDTGICGIELRTVSSDNKFPTDFQKDIIDLLSKDENKDHRISLTGSRGQRALLSLNETGEIISQELVFRHKMTDCHDEVAFDSDEESDGSIRLMDLIPVLYLGENREKVFVIDELDRSLHPKLCQQLLELFFERENSQTQMIVTTHESNLLTFDLLRRDEIWFVEKDINGTTHIYSLEEFAPRYDKDIQKGYLLGRFGAIPIIGRKQF
jgi:AAA15 family ATPase/GTPase